MPFFEACTEALATTHEPMIGPAGTAKTSPRLSHDAEVFFSMGRGSLCAQQAAEGALGRDDAECAQARAGSGCEDESSDSEGSEDDEEEEDEWHEDGRPQVRALFCKWPACVLILAAPCFLLVGDVCRWLLRRYRRAACRMRVIVHGRAFVLASDCSIMQTILTMTARYVSLDAAICNALCVYFTQYI